MCWSVEKRKVKHLIQFSANFQWAFDLRFCEFFNSPEFTGGGWGRDASPASPEVTVCSVHPLLEITLFFQMPEHCRSACALYESLSPLCNQSESSHHLELFLIFSKETPK